MTTFNPNKAAPKNSGIFGLPHTASESKIILLAAPWEVTTSYGGGTSKAPQAIFDASKQVDLFDLELGNFFEAGIHYVPPSPKIRTWNTAGKNLAKKNRVKAVKQINILSSKLNDFVYNETKKYLDKDKIVGLIGGDHSAPFGSIRAYVEKYPEMGVLHFDAHADLRNAYEGFEDSHASIMFNVIKKTPLKKLVQVGIRDFCEEEMQVIKENQDRIKPFFDANLKEKSSEGHTWKSQCDEIVSHLPIQVYISFDIDGLDPVLCPHTGTPVPGGLSFDEALQLIKRVVRSGRKIIGFDLNEVTPGPSGDPWDANVGARLLYKMCGWSLQN